VGFVVKGKILSSYPYRTLVRKTRMVAPEETSSSICFHQVPGLDKIFITSDPGIHISPDLETKTKILLNAVRVSRQLGCGSPRIMVLAAEHVGGALSQFSQEAEELRHFAEKGAMGPCRICRATNLHGLFGDRKISRETFPDIFLFPNIETGNILCKSIDHIMMGIRQCIAVGAGSIILAPSRSDPHKVRMTNLALGPVLTETRATQT
jgi:phosphate butyryltransferase